MPQFRRFAWLALVAGACGGRSYELAEPPSDDDSSSSGRSNGGSGGTTNGNSGGTSGSSSGTSGAAGDAPDSGGASGASTTGGASGASTTGGASAGGSAGTGAGNTGGAAGSTDPNCYPGLAQSGEECTMPCSVPCGFADMGTRECDCVGGYYLGCGCPRPPQYLGDRTAPGCPTPDGRALPLRGEPCTVEWAQCIGTDPVDSSIPRGCACLANELNSGELMWFCGSTNRWFSPE